jgi:hypothetical protein
MKKIITDNSISDFIRQSISEIQNGLPQGYEIVDEIEFEISVEAETNQKGELSFKIVSGEQTNTKVQTHKINFAIANKANQLKKSEAEALVNVKVMKSILETLTEVGQGPKTKKIKTTSR